MTGRPSVSRDRWLVSYADFMTLLCAFFTTLYASALVDASKTAADPAPAAPPPVAAPAAVAEVPVAIPEPAPTPAAHVHDDVRRQLQAALADDLGAGHVRLVDDPRGLVIEVPEGAVFEPGRAELSATARLRLARIGAALADLPNFVRVEGHTDDAPIRTARFQSNWELSTARATEVVALLVETAGIPAERLSAAGYGEHRPRAANDSVEGRARNRRVDLVILSAATATAEEPSVGGEAR